MADPDLELRGGGGGGGLDLLAMVAIFLSVISSFFTQNRGGGRAPWAPPLDPPLASNTNRVKLTWKSCTAVIHDMITCDLDMITRDLDMIIV